MRRRRHQLTVPEFRVWLREQIAAYRSQGAFAEAMGLSQSQLSDVLSGHRPPSRKFLAALKARLVPIVEIDAA